MVIENQIVVVAGAQGSLGKLVGEALLARARSEGRSLLVCIRGMPTLKETHEH